MRLQRLDHRLDLLPLLQSHLLVTLNHDLRLRACVAVWSYEHSGPGHRLDDGVDVLRLLELQTLAHLAVGQREFGLGRRGSEHTAWLRFLAPRADARSFELLADAHRRRCSAATHEDGGD